jgi:hypothetical protein
LGLKYQLNGGGRVVRISRSINGGNILRNKKWGDEWEMMFVLVWSVYSVLHPGTSFTSLVMGVSLPLVQEASLESGFMALEFFWEALVLGRKVLLKQSLFWHLLIFKCL